jgi:UDP-glucuronate 4-epimerase
MHKTFLVTGAAGFIGSHVAGQLLRRGDVVIGLDNLNDYYDVRNKLRNLDELRVEPNADRLSFHRGDFRDRDLVSMLFAKHRFDAVLHLGAMAGVRASIDDPQLYFDVNLNGTRILLDAAVGRLGATGATGATAAPNRHLTTFVFATTSSVYGATRQIPFIETDPCDRPLAPYAASKRAAEMLGHTYHHLYQLPFTALRFFTVYGPRNRPDMMAYKVLDNMFFGHQVPLYNNGQMHRDWTYIDDIVSGVVAAADRPMGYEIINLGRGQPVLLAEFVQFIEELTGRRANLTPAPMPDVDIPCTYADVSKARRLLDYSPRVSVKEGITRFWEWYRRAIPSGFPSRAPTTTFSVA